MHSGTLAVAFAPLAALALPRAIVIIHQVFLKPEAALPICQSIASSTTIEKLPVFQSLRFVAKIPMISLLCKTTSRLLGTRVHTSFINRDYEFYCYNNAFIFTGFTEAIESRGSL